MNDLAIMLLMATLGMAILLFALFLAVDHLSVCMINQVNMAKFEILTELEKLTKPNECDKPCSGKEITAVPGK